MVELDFRLLEALGFLVREWLDTEGDLVLLTLTEDPVVEVNGCYAIDCLSSARWHSRASELMLLLVEEWRMGMPTVSRPGITHPLLLLVRSRPAVV